MTTTKISKKAVILLSGGLDSTTTLAIAAAEQYHCYALSFDYGQRHNAELNAAINIAKQFSVVDHQIIPLVLPSWKNSALTNVQLAIPTDNHSERTIPTTYVPARNTIFLSFALAWAEVLEANAIFTGICAVDYSGYPDCRPEYLNAYQAMVNLATKTTISGQLIVINAPLMWLSKAEIIQKGASLGIDYAQTVSCYQANDQGLACGACASCTLRKKGFLEAKIVDPTRYIHDNSV